MKDPSVGVERGSETNLITLQSAIGLPSRQPWTRGQMGSQNGTPSATVIEYSEQRYLRSKKSVDDRALNRGVLATLKDALETLGRSPRVLEVGAGVGTMLPRLASWGILTSADYTFLERDATSLAEAKELGAPSSAFTLD